MMKNGSRAARDPPRARAARARAPPTPWKARYAANSTRRVGLDEAARRIAAQDEPPLHGPAVLLVAQHEAGRLARGAAVDAVEAAHRDVLRAGETRGEVGGETALEVGHGAHSGIGTRGRAMLRPSARGEIEQMGRLRGAPHHARDAAGEPDPIPAAVQRKILDAAIRAPSGGNTQMWRFMLVDDPAQKARLGPIYRACLSTLWDTIYKPRAEAAAKAPRRA